jgi:hypothetical protein
MSEILKKSNFFKCRRIIPFLFATLFLVGIGQTENAQFGVGPIGTRRQDVGQQHREAAVIVEPPNVDGAALLFDTEAANAVLHFGRQFIALWIPLKYSIRLFIFIALNQLISVYLNKTRDFFICLCSAEELETEVMLVTLLSIDDN